MHITANVPPISQQSGKGVGLFQDRWRLGHICEPCSSSNKADLCYIPRKTTELRRAIRRERSGRSERTLNTGSHLAYLIRTIAPMALPRWGAESPMVSRARRHVSTSTSPLHCQLCPRYTAPATVG